MKKIYLDNNSTTQIDSKVLNDMLPYFNEKYGNASSNSHAFGWEAKAAIDLSREQIAKLINAKSDEIIFTSGATESINLAIKGLLENIPLQNNIITSSIEHKAVLDVCKKINNNNSKVTFIKGLITVKSEISPTWSEGLSRIRPQHNILSARTFSIDLKCSAELRTVLAGDLLRPRTNLHRVVSSKTGFSDLARP